VVNRLFVWLHLVCLQFNMLFRQVLIKSGWAILLSWMPLPLWIMFRIHWICRLMICFFKFWFSYSQFQRFLFLKVYYYKAFYKSCFYYILNLSNKYIFYIRNNMLMNEFLKKNEQFLRDFKAKLISSFFNSKAEKKI